jgi:hypothetical protein
VLGLVGADAAGTRRLAEIDGGRPAEAIAGSPRPAMPGAEGIPRLSASHRPGRPDLVLDHAADLAHEAEQAADRSEQGAVLGLVGAAPRPAMPGAEGIPRLSASHRPGRRPVRAEAVAGDRLPLRPRREPAGALDGVRRKGAGSPRPRASPGEGIPHYEAEHRTLFAPIRRLFGLVREISGMIQHEVGAFG